MFFHTQKYCSSTAYDNLTVDDADAFVSRAINGSCPEDFHEEIPRGKIRAAMGSIVKR
jgi:hypothetical protein